MNIIDRGSGAPVVLVPGIQGRWEWLKPAVDALAARCRVITFSLADEPATGARFDADAGFRCYVEQIEDALDAAGVQRATICGISYGGLVAAAFAARKPERTAALVLASALAPSWRPDWKARFFMRAPTLLSPLFCINSLRLLPEMAAAKEGVGSGLAFGARHATNVVTHMFSPRRMVRRMHLLEGLDLEHEVSDLHVPTLVITGEPRLDRVVPVRITRDYLRLWPHADYATIERTGHIGSITRPDTFADLVFQFTERSSSLPAQRKRIV